VTIKKTFFSLIILFSLNINSTELKPLTSFIDENDLNDASILEYIAKRCSAHNLAMTRWTSEGDDVYELAMSNYLTWFGDAILFRTIKFPEQDQEIAAKNIIDSILVISEEIDNVMKYSQDMTGSVWEGNSFQTDMMMCNSFSKSMNKYR